MYSSIIRDDILRDSKTISNLLMSKRLLNIVKTAYLENVRKADKSALAYEKIGNLTLNEQRSAQWGKFIFFSLGQDLGARH